MNHLYNTIGLNSDPRIARQIEITLGNAETVLNVGAGAGSYEPSGFQITAVEPSTEMIEQRPASDATVIQGSAENLPFEDNSFDAAMAVLTIHHWIDKKKGVAELRRVTRGKIVFLTYDPSFHGFWLADYFPELVALDERQMPRMTDFDSWLGSVLISPVPIPHDCMDGFLAAYWQRPAAYLDERIRAAISSFWALGDVSSGLAKLHSDLESGEWKRRYSYLIDVDTLDCGYRLVETK